MSEPLTELQMQALTLVLSVMASASERWLDAQVQAGRAPEDARRDMREVEAEAADIVERTVVEVARLLEIIAEGAKLEAQVDDLQRKAAIAERQFLEGLRQSGRGIVNPQTGWWRC